MIVVVFLTGGVLETERAGGILDQPEVEGINGVLGQRKSVGL